MKQTRSNKKHFRCRVDEDVLKQFAILCRHYNISMSGMCTNFIENFVDENQEVYIEAIKSQNIDEGSNIEQILRKFMTWLEVR